MAAAIQARAGKNIGPRATANTLVAQKNHYQDLVLGNNTLQGIAPPAGQKNSYRCLNVSPFILTTGSSPLFFLIQNLSSVDITVRVAYRWDGKAADLLPAGTYVVPGAGRDLTIAAGAAVGFTGPALPFAGSVLPTDGPVTMTVAAASPLDGRVVCLYGVQDNANRNNYYRRVALTGSARVKLIEIPEGRAMAPFSILNVAQLPMFFAINCDTALDHQINFHLVDENGNTVFTAASAASGGIGPTAFTPVIPAVALPTGWSVEVSLPVAVSNPADPVIVIAEFQMADEAPVSAQGGGAY